MSETHTTRNAIIAGTAATVLGGLLLAPVRDLLVGAWRLLGIAMGALWSVLTASVSVWALLVIVIAVGLLAWRAGYEAANAELAPVVRGRLVDGKHREARPRLTELESTILRRLARADGELLTIDELAGARTKRLRVAQALERLSDLGLVEEHEGDAAADVYYGLTAPGRDLVIARGDV